MSARLADRQIRAAALRAAPTLDVRGPVSEALGRAGIVIPPAEAAPPEPTAPPATEGRPVRPRKTVGGVAAPDPVVKPFPAAPWPTRAGRTDDPERALSGLTADERRVHRILLDSLEREAAQSGRGGLTYAERKRLGTLDLAFINAQLAKMNGRGGVGREARLALGIGAGVLGVVVGVLLSGGEAGAALFTGVLTAVTLLLAVGIAWAVRSSAASRPSPRRQIYEALRELALLVDEVPVSDALDRADRLIDQFAGAVPGTAPPRTAAPPRRVRS